MLPKEDRKNLCWAMRKTLIDAIEANPTLTEAGKIAAKNYVVNEASYADLLNLTYNENRAEEYLPATVLEEVAVDQYRNYIMESAALAEEDEDGEGDTEDEGEPSPDGEGDVEDEGEPVQEGYAPAMASSYLFLRETANL